MPHVRDLPRVSGDAAQIASWNSTTTPSAVRWQSDSTYSRRPRARGDRGEGVLDDALRPGRDESAMGEDAGPGRRGTRRASGGGGGRAPAGGVAAAAAASARAAGGRGAPPEHPAGAGSERRPMPFIASVNSLGMIHSLFGASLIFGSVCRYW
jgi:hypothetical protein